MLFLWKWMPVLIQSVSGGTSNVWWNSQNAKSCVPSAGFHDGVQNDWQDMTPAWVDLQTGIPLGLCIQR